MNFFKYCSFNSINHLDNQSAKKHFFNNVFTKVSHPLKH